MDETTEEKQGYGKRPMWQWVVLYLLIAAVLYGAFYYFFLAKKGGYTNTPSAYTSPTVAATATLTPQAMSNEMTVTLKAENSSGESGTALLKEENGKTTVTLDLTGFVKGVTQPAHIHVGACPGVGAVKYPLTSVVDGKSVTVLPLSLSDLKKGLPLAINVHKSAKEVTVYTSCGELSSK